VESRQGSQKERIGDIRADVTRLGGSAHPIALPFPSPYVGFTPSACRRMANAIHQWALPHTLVQFTMVEIRIDQNELTIIPQGWSKLWTLRRKLSLPLSAVRSVQRAPDAIGYGWFKGIRFPGTHLPGVIVAGRFYHGGGWEFWDVRGSGRQAIEIALEDARYQRVVVDVSDPNGDVARLRHAIGRRAS